MVAALFVLAAAAVAAPEHAVILMYHHVDGATPALTSTRPEAFAQHLALLESEGCTVLPLAAIVAALDDEGVALPDGAVALTFDDGYRSVYTTAYPLLRERNWPFTVFVSPAAIDSGEGPACTWDQLREMARAGAEIAGHGGRHGHLQRPLPGEDDAAWRRRTAGELLAMRRRLEAEIGAAPTLLAYPYGEWSPALADLAAELGFTTFGQQSGPVGRWSDRRALPRFPAAGIYADPVTLADKLRSLPLPLASVAPRDPRLPLPTAAQPVPRPELTLTLREEAPGLGPAQAFDGERMTAVARDGLTMTVPAGPALPPGRSRTNVTAPSAWPGRWYWYSHAWIAGEEHDD